MPKVIISKILEWGPPQVSPDQQLCGAEGSLRPQYQPAETCASAARGTLLRPGLCPGAGHRPAAHQSSGDQLTHCKELRLSSLNCTRLLLQILHSKHKTWVF